MPTSARATTSPVAMVTRSPFTAAHYRPQVTFWRGGSGGWASAASP